MMQPPHKLQQSLPTYRAGNLLHGTVAPSSCRGAPGGCFIWNITDKISRPNYRRERGKHTCCGVIKQIWGHRVKIPSCGAIRIPLTESALNTLEANRQN